MREILESERLLLRPPRDTDLATLVALGNDFEVGKNLASMPYPYTHADAEAWIARAADRRARGVGYSFVIIRKADKILLGAVGIHPEYEFELGYWIGRPYWGQGYATEAAACAVHFAFEDLSTEKLAASWYDGNEASKRVLEKLGFTPNGAKMRDSTARGHAVHSNLMVCTRATCPTAQ